MTRRLAGFAAAAALVGGMALSGAGSQALAGNSWDRLQGPGAGQESSTPGQGQGNSWD
jgi:hypothetical protein